MTLQRIVCLLAALAIATTASATAASRRQPPALLDRPTAAGTTAAQSSSLEHVAQVEYSGGSDFEFATLAGRRYAFAGRLNAPVQVIDISVPHQPRVVAQVPCWLNQNDVQIRGTTLVMAADSRGTCVMSDGSSRQFIGFATADVSDPLNPRVIGIANVPRGAHNVTLHPGGRYVYVSNADLSGVKAYIHIWDIADPAQPRLVQNWFYMPGTQPHDITFSADGRRAYVAAIGHTDIVNTEDPERPVLVTTLAHPEIEISHQADPTPDGRYLLVSDEVGGGVVGPACPGGGIHVYDISVEQAPVKVGVFWADPTYVREGVRQGCTSHVFRINPDGRTLAVAWYTAGVHVIDFGDLLRVGAAGTGAATGAGARTIASHKPANADTWAAKMWPEAFPGYVFANDMSRGFDVYRLTPAA
ncbi:MAG TPA: hypothetical protein VNE62_00265 [Actinomycetota bacterium]|nr:hypothetical protein [Actinomycetota bacterium]